MAFCHLVTVRYCTTGSAAMLGLWVQCKLWLAAHRSQSGCLLKPRQVAPLMICCGVMPLSPLSGQLFSRRRWSVMVGCRLSVICVGIHGAVTFPLTFRAARCRVCVSEAVRTKETFFVGIRESKRGKPRRRSGPSRAG